MAHSSAELLHVPSSALRTQVETMAGFGAPETGIARMIGVDVETLRQHYAEEIESGHVKANTKVAENLYRKATGGRPGGRGRGHLLTEGPRRVA